MIKRLIIKNFQSHDNTTIDFSDGINTIIGSTDAGKTSMLRAIYWVCGHYYPIPVIASHWILKNEKLIGVISVSVVLDSGHTITRKRGAADVNSYDVDGVTYSAIGRVIPLAIKELLNMERSNFREAQDQHYLLSKTPGDIAKELNAVVNMESIDQVLFLVDAKKRKHKKDVGHLTETVAQLTEEKEKYHGLQGATDLMEEVEMLQGILFKKRERLDALYILTWQHQTHRAILDKYKKLATAESLQEKIRGTENIITGSKQEKVSLENLTTMNHTYQEVLLRYKNIPQALTLYRGIKELKQTIKEHGLLKAGLSHVATHHASIKQMIDQHHNIKTAVNLLEKISIEKRNIFDDRKTCNGLLALQQEQREQQLRIRGTSTRLKVLINSLPNMCPLCGATIKGELNI